MNLTKKTTVKYGQTDDVEKKFMKFDDVVALMQQAVKEPEHTGNYHDYVELCRLYDKNENGTMMLAELDTFLNLLGKWKIDILYEARSFITGYWHLTMAKTELLYPKNWGIGFHMKWIFGTQENWKK